MRAHLKTHKTGKVSGMAEDCATTSTVSLQTGVTLQSNNEPRDFPIDDLQVIDCVPAVTMATEVELQQISDVIATHSLLTEKGKLDQEVECNVEVITDEMPWHAGPLKVK